MTDALRDLPPHLRERLASALESGLLDPTASLSAVRSVVGGPDPESCAQALAAFGRLGVSGAAAAAWLRSLEQERAAAAQTDLVWSGPELAGLHARDTRRVYEELLGSAVRSLWVSTYAYFDGPRAFDVLARRMEAVADLGVTLLLNIGRRRGDTTDGEHLVRAFADRLWRVEWPGPVRPRVYYDPRALELDGPGGVLHAKVVVADGESVLVTSANLTEAAFDRNIELGLLVRDRALAGTVVAQFRGLIDRSLLRALPGE